MEIIKLTAERRTPGKKQKARQVRRAGQVPAVLYGKKQEIIPLAVDAHIFGLKLKEGARLFELDLDGQLQVVLLKELQQDTYGQSVVHADFLRVERDERITVSVPLRLHHVQELDLNHAVLTQNVHELAVEAPVVSLPDEVSLEVGHMQPGDTLMADQVELPEGVTLAVAPDTLLVSLTQRRGGEVKAEAEGEAAEGAAEGEGAGEEAAKGAEESEKKGE